MQRLLDDLPTTPAVVLGRRTDILAWNPMAAALFTGFARIPEKKRNFVRLVFCEPAIRALYPDWDWMAQISLAQLRMEAARDPKDPRLAELVGELPLADPDFQRWWGAHRGEQSAGRWHPVRCPNPDVPNPVVVEYRSRSPIMVESYPTIIGACGP